MAGREGFEYRVAQADLILAEGDLNRAGAEGWRVVAVVPISGTTDYYLVMERRLEHPVDRG